MISNATGTRRARGALAPPQDNEPIVDHESSTDSAVSSQFTAATELFEVMRVDGTYTDVRGKRYKVDQEINIKAQWTEATNSYQLAGFRGPLRPLYNMLDSIKKSLETIARQK